MNSAERYCVCLKCAEPVTHIVVVNFVWFFVRCCLPALLLPNKGFRIVWKFIRMEISMHFSAAFSISSLTCLVRCLVEIRYILLLFTHYSKIIAQHFLWTILRRSMALCLLSVVDLSCGRASAFDKSVSWKNPC